MTLMEVVMQNAIRLFFSGQFPIRYELCVCTQLDLNISRATGPKGVAHKFYNPFELQLTILSLFICSDSVFRQFYVGTNDKIRSKYTIFISIKEMVFF